MTHVALFLPELEAGGAQRVMLMLARELAARGHQVDLVLMHASGGLIASVPDNVHLVDLNARRYGFGQLGLAVSAVKRLARWLKQEQPDVLLSTITGANLVALLARKWGCLPLRVVIREAVTLKNVGSVLRLRAMRWLYPQADAVIALSSFMRDELVANIGVSPERISCIANPVDVDFICKQAQAPLEHPWLNDKRINVLVAVGRLMPQKDYVTLLRAFALLPEDVSARLIIVGEGPERAKLERLMRELGIEARVQLIGFDNNPWRWMARSDLFVLSSLWEGHPNALLEALALRLPVVVSIYDESIHELFAKIAGYPYRLVSVSKPEVMASAIELMCKDAPVITESFQIESVDSIDAYERLLISFFSDNK